jgi:hypothetical protein
MVSEDVRIAEKARIRIEAKAKYRESHREQLHMWDAQYRKKHRNELLERKKLLRRRFVASLSDVKLAELGREQSERNRLYREKNKEKLRQKDREYQKNHREERRMYDKLRQPFQTVFRRKRRLGTCLNGERIVIRGIIKRPYPPSSTCELCGNCFKRLVYHHWDNTEKILAKVVSDKEPLFVRGIWVCQPCNIFVHRLTEFPTLAEKWAKMKAFIEILNNPMRECGK